MWTEDGYSRRWLAKGLGGGLRTSPKPWIGPLMRLWPGAFRSATLGTRHWAGALRLADPACLELRRYARYPLS